MSSEIWLMFPFAPPMEFKWLIVQLKCRLKTKSLQELLIFYLVAVVDKVSDRTMKLQRILTGIKQ